MNLREIEKKFVERTATPEEEAMVVQQATENRYQELLWQRQRRDRQRNFERMGEDMQRVVPLLKSPFSDHQGLPTMLPLLCQGLALLIEELHHLNGGGRLG